MKSSIYYICLVLLLCTSCHRDADLPAVQLVACAPMPAPMAAGSSFAHQSSVYLFGGRNQEGQYSNQLWQYHTLSDQWTSLGTTPLAPRVSSSACVVDDCAYIGLGFSGILYRDTNYLRDFWQYNLLTRQWKRLADFPEHTTVCNCLVQADGYIYALYGFYRQFTHDVYRYDIEHDRWEKLDVSAPARVPRAMNVVGATCQGRCFVGTGFNHGSLRFWAEWCPAQLQLVPRKPILGAGRNAASCCATHDYIYLVGGRHYGDTLTTGFFYSSIQRYRPDSDQWEYLGHMPYEAENMVAASANGQIFIGLGEDPAGHIQPSWYRIDE